MTVYDLCPMPSAIMDSYEEGESRPTNDNILTRCGRVAVLLNEKITVGEVAQEDVMACPLLTEIAESLFPIDQGEEDA
jgi:hypothetical protein